MKKVFNEGPSGGTGGKSFVDDAIDYDGVYLKEIRVRSGKRIDSIQCIYEESDGHTYIGPTNGGSGGESNHFILDDDEFIQEVRGRYGSRLDSIQFITDRQQSPVYGGSGGGSQFRYMAPENFEIIGFFGRAGEEVDAIGVILRNRDN